MDTFKWILLGSYNPNDEFGREEEKVVKLNFIVIVYQQPPIF